MRCVTQNRNTGASRCQMDMAKIIRAIITPLNARFTGETQEELDEWIEQNIHNDNPARRFYPLPAFNGNEPTVEDPATSAAGYGDQYYISNGAINSVFTYPPDYCLANKLTVFNGRKIRVILIDEKGVAWGAQTATGFAGFEVLIWTSQAGLPDGTEQSLPTIRFSFTSIGVTEFQSQKAAYELTVGPTDIKGLEDVQINITGSTDPRTVTILADCGNENITEEFGTAAAVVGAWTVDGEAPSAAPTYNAVANTFSFTGLTTGQQLNLAGPTELLALGIDHKESTGPVAVP